MRKMTGHHQASSIRQLAHHSIYVMNIIARFLGLTNWPEKGRFDPHTQVLDREILSHSPKIIVETLFAEATPKKLIESFLGEVNPRLMPFSRETELGRGARQILLDMLNRYLLDEDHDMRFVWEEGEQEETYRLTPYGAAALLMKAGVLFSPPTDSNSVKFRLQESPLLVADSHCLIL